MINMLLPLAGKLIERVLPDKEAQAKAKIELIKAQQEGELAAEEMQLKRDMEQIALNKIEAGSSNLFKSGWRPAVGWVCVVGLIYATVAYPLLTWAATVYNITPPPNLDTGLLITVLGGILGIGGMRSWEKRNGLTK